MNTYAPILITTLNRYKHFRRCVESLSSCVEADKTVLYIAFDYPLKDSHWEGYLDIEQYLSDIKGFRDVIIIKRDVNYGAERNYFEASSTIFKKYDRLIISEDDNEFSRNFLVYMNKGLNIYKNRKDVFSICGYNYPVKMPQNYNSNIYLWKGFSAWGCGIWKDKWEEISFSTDEINSFLVNPRNVLLSEKYSSHYMPALLQILNKNHMTADTFISMYLIKNNMYCLFPYSSMVRNHGHDGSGVHGGILTTNIYLNQSIDENSSFEFLLESNNLEENIDVNRVLKKHFKLNKLRWLYTYYKYTKYLAIHYLKLKVHSTENRVNL